MGSEGVGEKALGRRPARDSMRSVVFWRSGAVRPTIKMSVPHPTFIKATLFAQYVMRVLLKSCPLGLLVFSIAVLWKHGAWGTCQPRVRWLEGHCHCCCAVRVYSSSSAAIEGRRQAVWWCSLTRAPSFPYGKIQQTHALSTCKAGQDRKTVTTYTCGSALPGFRRGHVSRGQVPGHRRPLPCLDRCTAERAMAVAETKSSVKNDASKNRPNQLPGCVSRR